MPRPRLSRRSFLALSGGVVAGAALAPTIEGVAGAAAAAGRNTEISPLVLSSDLHASPDPQRFVFAIAVGPRYSSTKRAQVAFSPPGGSGEGTVLDTRLHKRGLPKGRGVYVADVAFPQAGVWDAVVLTRGTEVPFAVEVKPQPDAPIVGSAAPRVPSPTKAAPLGVKPICTRKPRCPLHTVSLADVIGTGKPVAAMFATPALCASMYCGPVLDELLEVRDAYADAVELVHIEIYDSNRGATLSPTVDGWGLPSEPWLYTIDAAGSIVGRLDGAFGQDEIVAALDALTGRA